MKKFLLVVLLMFLSFSFYIIYDEHVHNIKKLVTEEEIINIDDVYVYGTYLNIHSITDINLSNFDLVLYDSDEDDFISVKLNLIDDGFNLSDYINDGIYLEQLDIGNYYLFLRSHSVNEDDEDVYKYYVLNNISNYDETIYYSFSKKNNKIIINSDNDYSTMMIQVKKNTDNEIYDIVIDPGHGGMDSGAFVNDYKESDLTMLIATKLKEKLEDSGYKVKLTREEDQLSDDETLDEYGEYGRAVVASSVKAKYLLSIHMNSNNSESVNGLEIYTADNINYDFIKSLANNITTMANINYSSNKLYKISNGIYTRNFNQEEVDNLINKYNNKDMEPYDVTTRSNYFYIIRESGGILTGAFVDDRNETIDGNPYVLSNIGTEAYLLELGYMTNNDNLENMINNMDDYVDAIAYSFDNLNKK